MAPFRIIRYQKSLLNENSLHTIGVDIYARFGPIHFGFDSRNLVFGSRNPFEKILAEGGDDGRLG